MVSDCACKASLSPLSSSDWMSASSVCRAELFLCVLVTLGEETELVRLVELELMILLASGWTCSSELVLQDEKEELLCFLNEETQLTCLESSQL